MHRKMRLLYKYFIQLIVLQLNETHTTHSFIINKYPPSNHYLSKTVHNNEHKPLVVNLYTSDAPSRYDTRDRKLYASSGSENTEKNVDTNGSEKEMIETTVTTNTVTTTAAATDTILEDIRAMRVRDIKTELSSLGISTKDAFEKEELIQRLLDARIINKDEKKQEIVSAEINTTTTITAAATLEDIRSMRVKDIKTELSSLGISTKDAFEKEELIQRLLEARVNNTETQHNTNINNNRIEVPLHLYSLDTSQSIYSASDENVFLRPSPGKFAAIKLTHPQSSQDIMVLVDTACSGLVINPRAVQRLGLNIYDSPVTMTAAGGTNVGGTKLSQLDRFEVDGGGGRVFGPIPVAVQDIGALPSALDGILGLSFLSQFAAVDFDFKNQKLILHNKLRESKEDSNTKHKAKTDMKLTKLGIYTADIFLDEKGPVKLLVDTGGAATILNWKGISDLSLTKSSNEISPIPNPIGAMGADNIAIQLSHRLVVSERVGFHGRGHVKLDADKKVEVDIGELPILDALKGDDVGGILGMDIFMSCEKVRFFLGGRFPEMIFYP